MRKTLVTVLLLFLCVVVTYGQRVNQGLGRVEREPLETQYSGLFRMPEQDVNDIMKPFAQRLNVPSAKYLPSSIIQAPSKRSVNIMGSLTYNNIETFMDWGMYRITSPDYTAALICKNDDFKATGGGVLIDNFYYCINVKSIYGYNFVKFRKIDIQTWTQVEYRSTQHQDSGTDITYDPITKTVYGCFVNDASNGYVWGTLNLETGKRQFISHLSIPLSAVAADKNGQIYTVANDGILYTVEKTTGTLKEVGPTGLQLGGYYCAGTIDQKTGIFYFSACLADKTSGLYEVDLTTGAAELIYNYPNGEMYQGIYVEAPLAEDGAPAAPQFLEANFPNGSTTGTVSFSVPTTTFAGDALSGELSYSIVVNGTEMVTGKTTAGAKVSKEITLAAGMADFEVSLSNAIGQSPMTKISLFVGKDAPKAVTDLNISGEVSGEIKLTWKAPTATVNGGYFDEANLKYKVVRMPENVVLTDNLVETIYVDKLQSEFMQSVWYEVTPFIGDMLGEVATSGSTVIGEYVQLPYTQTFEDVHSLDLFTVINVHGDKYTWKYDEYRQLVTCEYDFNNPKDDWLILPAFKLENNFVYKLSFNTSTKRKLPESFEIRMGKGKTVADMTTVIMADTTLTTQEDIIDIECLFENNIQVKESGIYYIGIHATSKALMHDLRLDNLKMEAVSELTAPQAVTELTAVAAEKGVLEATLTFTTPTVTISGDALTVIPKVEVKNEGEVVGVLQNPEVGKQVSIKVPAKQGINDFRVIAYNEIGAGVEALVKVYAGVDIPDRPLNVNLKLENGELILTWEASEVGEKGGFVDVNALSYVILRGSDKLVVDANHKGTTYRQGLLTSENQMTEQFVVYAKSAAGTGKGATSNQAIWGGKSHELPFTESFVNAMFGSSPWGLSGETSLWWLTSKADGNGNPQDNDKGLVYYVPEAPNDKSSFFTPRVSLDKTAKPAISFYYYQHNMLKNVKLTIAVTENYLEFTPVKEFDFNTVKGQQGWNKVVVELDAFKGKKDISIAFIAENGEKDYGNIYVDNLKVFDNLENNLTLTDFNCPTGMEIGAEYVFGCSVENRGSKDCAKFTVDLLRDGEVIQTKEVKELVADYGMDFEFKDMATADFAENVTYQVVVNYAADENQEDNKSAVKSVVVETPEYPFVKDLTGKDANGQIELNWTAPEVKYVQAPTLETFETYDSFIIENIGDWKLHDADGQITFVISYQGKPVQYKNSGQPMAYQVFNAGLAGIGEQQTGVRAFEAYEGVQCLNAFNAEIGQSDDWLISPELNGKKQFLSFFVKSALLNFGHETYEVLVSKTGNELQDFVKVEGLSEQAPPEWKQIVVPLEEGTKYFAIRCTSNQHLTMMLDNIKFIRANAQDEKLEILGYNVYRDGVKINQEPVKEPSYVDKFGDGGKHMYQVTVVYKQGESVKSNSCELQTTNGIEKQSLNGVVVKAAVGKILVDNVAGFEVIVYSVDGKEVYKEIAENGNCEIYVQAGVYLVKVDSEVWKVNVR